MTEKFMREYKKLQVEKNFWEKVEQLKLSCVN